MGIRSDDGSHAIGSRAPLGPGTIRECGVTQTTGPATMPHRTYRHEAFLYQGDAAFLQGTLPFIRDAAAAAEPVMVATTGPRLDLLRDALGQPTGSVHWVDMTQLGRNPARIIPAWLHFLEAHASQGRSVRGIGEPVWAGRRPEEIVECHLNEALLNLAFDPDTPLWLRCPYDTEALGAPVVDEARRNHPLIYEADRHHNSPAYRTRAVGTTFDREFPEPTAQADETVFGPRDLAAVRAAVTRHAGDAGMAPDRVAELELAIHEIATNSLRHAGGTGTLRIWQDSRMLVCEVRDRGRLIDPLVGRTKPPDSSEGGRGVWLANHLCDLVQIQSNDQGTTIRLLSWL